MTSSKYRFGLKPNVVGEWGFISDNASLFVITSQILGQRTPKVVWNPYSESFAAQLGTLTWVLIWMR
jgi:hypothetical protein